MSLRELQGPLLECDERTFDKITIREVRPPSGEPGKIRGSPIANDCDWPKMRERSSGCSSGNEGLR